MLFFKTSWPGSRISEICSTQYNHQKMNQIVSIRAQQPRYSNRKKPRPFKKRERTVNSEVIAVPLSCWET